MIQRDAAEITACDFNVLRKIVV